MDDIAHRWRQPHQFEGTDHYGIRLINLTSTQRDALTGAGAAKAGALIWNTTTTAVEFYDGSSWLILPNNLDATEFGFLNGVSAGQFPAASKAVVAGSDGFVPTRRHIIADGANVVLTSADSGGIVVLDKTDGSQTTLPEITASTLGMEFEFVVTAARASGSYKIITGNAADFMFGDVYMVDTDSSNALSIQTADGSADISVTIDDPTKGGLVGDRLLFTAISATQWWVQGKLQHTGNVADPFAAS